MVQTVDLEQALSEVIKVIQSLKSLREKHQSSDFHLFDFKEATTEKGSVFGKISQAIIRAEEHERNLRQAILQKDFN